MVDSGWRPGPIHWISPIRCRGRIAYPEGHPSAALGLTAEAHRREPVCRSREDPLILKQTRCRPDDPKALLNRSVAEEDSRLIRGLRLTQAKGVKSA